MQKVNKLLLVVIQLLLARRPPYMHGDKISIVNFIGVVTIDWLCDAIQRVVCDLIFTYLITIGSVQIYHVKLIYSFFQEQNKKVIGIRNACVTDRDILTLRRQLNPLDKFSIKSIDQEKVIAESRISKVWPARTLSSHEGEDVTHYFNIFVIKHLLSGIGVILQLLKHQYLVVDKVFILHPNHSILLLGITVFVRFLTKLKVYVKHLQDPWLDISLHLKDLLLSI